MPSYPALNRALVIHQNFVGECNMLWNIIYNVDFALYLINGNYT